MGEGWAYVSCQTPADGPTQMARDLESYLRSLDPGGRSGGIFNRRRVAGSSAWSVHACGRAVDWFPSSRTAGDFLFGYAVFEHKRAGIQLVLWRQLQFGGRTGPLILPTTRRDHHDHLHLEVVA